MKILIVDDIRLNLIILSAFCTKQNHTVVTARNGKEAVAQFSREAPDIILMDVKMPVMDGFEATSKIKRLSVDRWVPVILVTALVDEENLIRGIESGADDYLTKPVNLTLLGEKIKIMERIIRVQENLHENVNELKVYRENMEEELSLTAHVMEKLSSEMKVDQSLVQQWNLPAKGFSGDVISAVMQGKDKLNLILGDATGHGLSAALCMMPVTSVFYGMSAKGFSIGAIAREINKKVAYLLPKSRFIAAVLVSVDWTEKTIDVWNGGGTQAVLIDGEGHLLRGWKSRHVPLGILSDEDFSEETDSYKWEDSGQLFLYSDGLTDARDKRDGMFGTEALMRTLLAAPPLKQFETLKDAVKRHLAGPRGDDDISLVAVRCPGEIQFKTDHGLEAEKKTGVVGPSQWRLDVKLLPSDIRKIDILPILLNWLKQIGVGKKDCQRLFMIFSELYNNALDHGLLGLDSKLKASPSGFDEYLSKRSERLLALKEGSIDIHVEHIKTSEEDHIKLRVKDSGPGFGFQSHLRGNVTCLSAPSGRGIQLVNQLSTHLRYMDGGSDVEVIYPLKRD